MEVFSLLKYWKGGGGITGCSSSSTTSFVTAASERSDDDGDDFFDLELTDDEAQKVDRESEIVHQEEEANERKDVVRVGGKERKLRFMLSSSPNEVRISSGCKEEEREELKSGFFRNVDSPLRTATKLRVLMLRLKRSKSESTATEKLQPQIHRNQPNNHHNNNIKQQLFTMRFKPEVPIFSLLTRASSTPTPTPTPNTNTAMIKNAAHHHHQEDEEEEEKRMKKTTQKKEAAVQKHLKMATAKSTSTSSSPQIGVSKRKQAAEEAAAAEAVAKSMKRLNLKKSLPLGGKMSKAAVVPSMASKRRDDSLLQYEDAIHSAILHCKRSFNSS